MSDFTFHAPDQHRKNAWIQSMDEYQKMYQQSIEHPEEFWADMAKNFYWEKPWDKVREYNYSISEGPVRIEWFKNAFYD